MVKGRPHTVCGCETRSPALWSGERFLVASDLPCAWENMYMLCLGYCRVEVPVATWTWMCPAWVMGRTQAFFPQKQVSL